MSKHEDTDVIDQFFGALDNIHLTRLPEDDGPEVPLGKKELLALYETLRKDNAKL